MYFNLLLFLYIYIFFLAFSSRRVGPPLSPDSGARGAGPLSGILAECGLARVPDEGWEGGFLLLYCFLLILIFMSFLRHFTI